MPKNAASSGELASVDEVLDQHIPADKLAEVKRILYGRPVDTVDLPAAATGTVNDIFYTLYIYILYLF